MKCGTLAKWYAALAFTSVQHEQQQNHMCERTQCCSDAIVHVFPDMQAIHVHSNKFWIPSFVFPVHNVTFTA